MNIHWSTVKIRKLYQWNEAACSREWRTMSSPRNDKRHVYTDWYSSTHGPEALSAHAHVLPPWPSGRQSWSTLHLPLSYWQTLDTEKRKSITLMQFYGINRLSPLGQKSGTATMPKSLSLPPGGTSRGLFLSPEFFVPIWTLLFL